MTPSHGFLVVIEGIDGAGTTSQSRSLLENLMIDGLRVHPTAEPSTGPIGKLLREYMAGTHSCDSTTIGLLFAADRVDHIRREVEPALSSGYVVVTDRWYHSSLAYQGTDTDREWITEINRHAIVPDLTIFLDVSPEVAIDRRDARGSGNPEIYEYIDVLTRVAANYRDVMSQLSATEPVAVIDGNRPYSEVSAEIYNTVAEAMNR
jgi:dTMP kinase